MISIDFIQNARPFSFIMGFLTGIASMIYLLLTNEPTTTHSLTYITFFLMILLLSNILAVGSFFVAELFTPKPKKHA